jgi:hypothetical protein
MDFKVTFAAQAERDLFAIVRFLAQKNRPLLAGWVTLCSTRPYRSHKCRIAAQSFRHVPAFASSPIVPIT